MAKKDDSNDRLKDAAENTVDALRDWRGMPPVVRKAISDLRDAIDESEDD